MRKTNALNKITMRCYCHLQFVFCEQRQLMPINSYPLLLNFKNDCHKYREVLPQFSPRVLRLGFDDSQLRNSEIIRHQ